MTNLVENNTSIILTITAFSDEFNKDLNHKFVIISKLIIHLLAFSMLIPI